MTIREQAESAHPLRTTAGRDELAWAKRIMYREQHKDRDLMPIQVDFAKRALGIKEPPKS